MAGDIELTPEDLGVSRAAMPTDGALYGRPANTLPVRIDDPREHVCGLVEPEDKRGLAPT